MVENQSSSDVYIRSFRSQVNHFYGHRPGSNACLQLGLDLRFLQVIVVVGLDLDGETEEALLNLGLGRGVEHALLDFTRRRRPVNEDELFNNTALTNVRPVVEDGVDGSVIGKLFKKLGV